MPLCLAASAKGASFLIGDAGISIPRIEIVGMSSFISFYHLSRKCSDLFDTKGKLRHKNFKNLIYIKNTMLFKKILVPLKYKQIDNYNRFIINQY